MSFYKALNNTVIRRHVGQYLREEPCKAEGGPQMRWRTTRNWWSDLRCTSKAYVFTRERDTCVVALCARGFHGVGYYSRPLLSKPAPFPGCFRLGGADRNSWTELKAIQKVVQALWSFCKDRDIWCGIAGLHCKILLGGNMKPLELHVESLEQIRTRTSFGGDEGFQRGSWASMGLYVWGGIGPDKRDYYLLGVMPKTHWLQLNDRAFAPRGFADALCASAHGLAFEASFAHPDPLLRRPTQDCHAPFIGRFYSLSL